MIMTCNLRPLNCYHSQHTWKLLLVVAQSHTSFIIFLYQYLYTILISLVYIFAECINSSCKNCKQHVQQTSVSGIGCLQTYHRSISLSFIWYIFSLVSKLIKFDTICLFWILKKLDLILIWFFLTRCRMKKHVLYVS